MMSYRRDRSVKDRPLAPGTRRRVLGYARPYRTLIIVFLSLVVFDACLVVLTPLLLRRIVDHGIRNHDRGQVVLLSLIVALVALVQTVENLVSRYYSARIGEGLIYDLRTQVFAHVLRQPVAFFTRAQTGALVSRLNSDVRGAQQAFTSTLSGVVSNVVSLVLVTAAMLYLSWPITLGALVLLPVFLLPARRFGVRLQALAREQMQVNADLGNRMTERFNVAGALLVKLFGRPGQEDAEFAARAGRVRDTGVQIAMNNQVFFAGLTLVAALAMALVYGLGGVLVIDGTLTVGTLLALAALLGRLYGPLTGLSNVRVDVMTALVSFERVFEVLDLVPLVREAPEPKQLPRRPLSVELDDVRFGYPSADQVALATREPGAPGDRRGGAEVLHGITLQVQPGRASCWPWSARAGPASRPSPAWSPGSTTRPPGPSGSVGSTCGRPVSSRCTTRSASSPRTRTCSTTRSAPTCSTPPRRPARSRCWPRCARPRSPT